MTDVLASVLIPYARFLECRERRLRIATELTQRDGQRTIDAEVLSAAVENDERARDAARVLGTDPAAGVQQS